MNEGQYKWRAQGINGHSEAFGNEFFYTSDNAPVEADEYERMKARAEAAGAERDALRAECDEWRDNYAALEAVAIASERERQVAEAKLALVDEYGHEQWLSGVSGNEFEAGPDWTFAEWLAEREEQQRYLEQCRKVQP